MEPEGPSPCSQQPATGLYPESEESIPHSHTPSHPVSRTPILRGPFENFVVTPYYKSRDNSVGIAVGYGLGDRGSRIRFPAGAGNFSLHHRVHNGSGAHPASYPMGTRGSFPGAKAAGTWSWPLTPSSAEVKECVELYLHSPNTPSWRGAQLKHRGNFTLVYTLLLRVGTCGGAMTVSLSKYLPWQAMHFVQRSTHFSKTRCRPLITSKFLAWELPFHGWKSPEIVWGEIWTVWRMF
jgi:hypothetical protein